MQKVEYKNLKDKTTYFIYTINELLNFSKEERGQGFYRALATKVITRDFRNGKYHQMQMPSLYEIPNKDERTYIHKVCPDLDCVLEDATSGNEEAQMVMSKMYSEYLPKNIAKANFWSMKSWHSSYDFPPLIRYVDDN